MRWSDVGVFILVIVVVSGIGSYRAQRGRAAHSGARAVVFHPLGFIIGGDNRLSLSRLQAFLWTIAIFATYLVAWRAHGAVRPATPETVQKIETLAKQTRERAIQSHSASVQAAVDEGFAFQQLKGAVQESTTLIGAISDTVRRKIVADSVKSVMAAARKQAIDSHNTAVVAYRAAARDSAQAYTLEAEVARYKWIVIPAALLALAGISVGSGVLSSLISAVNNRGLQPCVTALRMAFRDDLLKTYPNLGVPRADDLPCVVIYGANLGSTGRVRFGRDFADVLYWGDDGKAVVVAPSVSTISGLERTWAGTLIVDTPNGKMAYGTGRGQKTEINTEKPPSASLGSATDALEWSDLFRDDGNPTNLDLMKFQMFGWTIVGLLLYLANFFSALGAQHVLSSLPAIDDSLVVLMGVSQAAYLANKGVQNVQPSGDRGNSGTPAKRISDSALPGIAETNRAGQRVGSSAGLIPPDDDVSPVS